MDGLIQEQIRPLVVIVYINIFTFISYFLFHNYPCQFLLP